MTRTEGVEGVTLRANEGIGVPGWDGEVGAAQGSAYVPAGSSAWEIGTGADPETKAEGDYTKRSEKPLGLTPAQSVFVFVTSRRWKTKQDWATAKKEEGVWRDVRVLDCDDLHGWLELHPGVHIWISEQLGRRPLGVETLERWAAQWSTQTDPALPLGLLLAGRANAAKTVRAKLADDAIAIGVKAGSRDEALAFIAAGLLIPPPPAADAGEANSNGEAEAVVGASDPAAASVEGEESESDYVEEDEPPGGDLGEAPAEAAEPGDTLSGARALVVQDPVVWRRPIDSPSSLVLLPITEEADIGAALAAGHHVIRPLGPAARSDRSARGPAAGLRLVRGGGPPRRRSAPQPGLAAALVAPRSSARPPALGRSARFREGRAAPARRLLALRLGRLREGGRTRARGLPGPRASARAPCGNR